MTAPLAGTVALVTGASSGIGEATAIALAREGADVAVVARREDRLQTLAQKISELGRRALVIGADVSQEASAYAAIEHAVQELGRLDVTVANAGVMLSGPIEDAPIDEWRQMVDVNVFGAIYTARAALQPLLQAAETSPRRVADLVLTSSTAGRISRPGSGVYALTKHGIGAFGEVLRQEMATRHVRVALLEPGSTQTELGSNTRPEVKAQASRRTAGIERMEAQDIAEAVAFIVTRPRHVAVNELLIRPTEQEN